jgi:hypothetical protein
LVNFVISSFGDSVQQLPALPDGATAQARGVAKYATCIGGMATADGFAIAVDGAGDSFVLMSVDSEGGIYLAGQA